MTKLDIFDKVYDNDPKVKVLRDLASLLDLPSPAPVEQAPATHAFKVGDYAIAHKPLDRRYDPTGERWVDTWVTPMDSLDGKLVRIVAIIGKRGMRIRAQSHLAVGEYPRWDFDARWLSPAPAPAPAPVKKEPALKKGDFVKITKPEVLNLNDNGPVWNSDCGMDAHDGRIGRVIPTECGTYHVDGGSFWHYREEWLTLLPDPGEGYRYLQPSEIVEEGDEFWNKYTQQWVLTGNHRSEDKRQGHNPYRRKVVTPSEPYYRDLTEADLENGPVKSQVKWTGCTEWMDAEVRGIQRCPEIQPDGSYKMVQSYLTNKEDDAYSFARIADPNYRLPTREDIGKEVEVYTKTPKGSIEWCRTKLHTILTDKGVKKADGSPPDVLYLCVQPGYPEWAMPVVESYPKIRVAVTKGESK